MADMASGTFYLALSLAAAAHPAAAAAQVSAAPAAPADQPSNSTSSDTHRNGYVIVDVPVRRSDAKTVDSVIAEEARRAVKDDLSGERYFADNATLAASDLNQGVVAEHDARIAMLKQRIEKLKSGNAPDAAKQLDELKMRLRRAEAARGLALARATLEPACTSDCPPASALAAQEASSPAIAASGAAVPPAAEIAPLPKERPANKKPPQYQAATGHRLAEPRATPRSIRTPAEPDHWDRMAATTTALRVTPAIFHDTRRKPHAQRIQTSVHLVLRPGGNVPIVLAKGRSLIVRTAADRATAEKLRRSRYLLSIARQSLGEPARPLQRPIHLEGLWKFEGSERWSLADYPHRAA